MIAPRPTSIAAFAAVLALTVEAALSATPQAVTFVPLAEPSDRELSDALFSGDSRTVFLTHGDSRSLTRYDLTTQTLTGRLELGAEPIDLALDEAGARLFAQLGDGRLLQIDTAQLSVQRTIWTAPLPFGDLTIDDGTNRALVITGSLARLIDLGAGTLIHQFALPPTWHTTQIQRRAFFSADGGEVIVFVQSGPNPAYEMFALNATNGQVARSLALLGGDQPYALLPSTDRTQFLVQRQIGGVQTIERYATSSFALLGTTTTTGGLFVVCETFDASSLRVGAIGSDMGFFGRSAFSLAVPNVFPGQPGLVQIYTGGTAAAFSNDVRWMSHVTSNFADVALTDLIGGGAQVAVFDTPGVSLSRFAFSTDTTRLVGWDPFTDWFAVFERTPSGFSVLASASSSLLPGMDGARGLTYFDDTEEALVHGVQSANTSLVDVANGALVATLQLGAQPISETRLPSGEALVGASNGELLVLTRAPLAVAQRLALGGGAVVAVRPSATAGRVWARIQKPTVDELVLCGVSPLQVLRRFPLSASSVGTPLQAPFVRDTFAPAEALGRVFVVRRDGHVDVVDIATGQVSTFFVPIAATQLDWSVTVDELRGRAFVKSSAPSVAALDLSSTVPTLLWSLRPPNQGGLTWSASAVLSEDGSALITSMVTDPAWSGSGIVALDAATGAVVDVAPTAPAGSSDADYDFERNGDAIIQVGVIGIEAYEFRNGQFSDRRYLPTGTNSALGRIHFDRARGRVVAVKPASRELARVNLIAGLSTTTCNDGAPNSIGSRATLAAAGSPYAGDQIVLTCSGLAPGGMVGYPVVATQLGPPIQLPFSAGRICLGGVTGRISSQAQAARPDGTHRYGLSTATMPLSTGSAAVLPGSTWHFQTWYRDSTVSGAPTSNTSNALSLTFR